jgi:lipopolysaccharide/colanic/teichoic acid biosynthesis glycosyltransferase
MELDYIQEEKTTKKTYRHYTITSNPVVENTGTKKLEFFYIGKKIGNIDRLINAFESGYAAENTANAKSMLRRLMSNNRAVTIPDIIIAEASLGGENLRDLHQFLATHKLLAGVPFILEASGMQPAEVTQFRKYSFVDEIIFLQDYCKATLVRKVNFLKKIKYRLAQGAESRIESFKQKTTTALFFKRSFDVVISSSILLALSPLLLLIAAAIRMESRGPIFYVAKRAGRGYRIFDFYKFRTMAVDADKKIKDLNHLNQYAASGEGPVFFKIDNDPRITKVGIFLRKTSLDELPQLLNVLIGNMSLVGNRPLPLYEAASLTTDEFAKRFMAPAGMTGLWQIKKRGKKDMSVEERITLDIDYAEKYSFLYDMWIMANTPSALIQKTNA